MSKVEFFQAMFPRAANQQKTLAIGSILGGVGSYAVQPSHPHAPYFLTAGLSLTALVGWTYAAIMPINYQLMDGEGTISSIPHFKKALPNYCC